MVPIPPNQPAAATSYSELISFLLKPFLAPTDTLVMDCEQANPQARLWLRLAVQSEDKGRVFGRGGRNIHAIRTVLETAASVAGQSVFLDVYDSEHELGSGGSNYPPRRRRIFTENAGETDRFQRRRSRPRYGSEP